MQREAEIFCPKCEWRPTGESRWRCAETSGGCGTVWHTFWTGGCCPGCGHFWEVTQCLSCRRFSPHQDWYHLPPGTSVEHEEACELERT